MRKRIKRYFLCSIRSCWSLKFTMTNIIIVGALLLIGLCLVLSVDLSSTTPLEDIVAETSTSMPEERSEAFKPYWTWQCKYNKCVKEKISHSSLYEQSPQSLGVCKLKCGEYRTLWPRPTGELIIGDELVPVNPTGVEIMSSPGTTRNLEGLDDEFDMVAEMTKRFQAKMSKMFSKKLVEQKRDAVTRTLYINLNIGVESLSSDLNGDEAYQIRTLDSTDHINATITANTFFGAHHGVETLSQLIVYDPYTSAIVMPERVELSDKPVYPYRGILLDTGRNFIPLEHIKRTLDAMAVNKLNYFHWHITDSQSFPFESRKYPTLTQSGAYSSEKIYSRDDIRDIVHYGLVRGVHVIPELDAPAHVGEGWNSLENHKEELVVCFKKEPWTKFCVEPPCGQLNPVSDKVYEVLGNLYEEMTDLFRTDLSGLFHMGGDEVNMNCWNHTKPITDWMTAKDIPRTIDGFHEVWDYFQKKALHKLSNTKNRPKKAIIWTSSLTEGNRLVKYLDRNKYIIQIWTAGNDPQVTNLLQNKFPVIFSNYEALYFDCGFGAWVGEGNNWCSPYIGWQKVYDNDPIKLLDPILQNDPAIKPLIMGQEATLWTEQADGVTLDGRLWPRAAAMGERLWSNPATGWRDAEYRFLHQRERLVELGLAAESIEPEWCYQNDGLCGTRS
uniref:Beta-hexosaminidase n=1 Tax=Cacopsylla melanoneura TaxID=428564 RepID=A0A8D8Q8N8_9HEMI